MGCFGGNGGTTVIQAPPAPGPSAEEIAIQQEMLKIMQRGPTEQEKLLMEYSKQILEQQIQNLPMDQEYKEMALKIARTQYEELTSPEAMARKELEAEVTQWQLEGVQAAREMGAITGDLSEQEMTALDTMEQNAIQTLQEVVGRESTEVMSGVVAEMVDRGVLQGSVGAQAIAQVGERTQEILGMGVRAIETQKMGQVLQLGEAQKGRQLQMQQMLQAGIVSPGQAQQFVSQSLLNQANVAQQMQMAGQQFGQQLGQEREMGVLTGAIQQWGQMAGMRGQQAQRGLEAAIASAQAATARRASTQAMWGQIAGGAMQAGGMMGGAAILASSRSFKKDIREIDSMTEQEMLDDLKGVKLYKYKYKIDDDKEHTGPITEELPEAVVTKDGKFIDVVSYLGYLTACVKALAQRLEANHA